MPIGYLYIEYDDDNFIMFFILIHRLYYKHKHVGNTFNIFCSFIYVLYPIQKYKLRSTRSVYSTIPMSVAEGIKIRYFILLNIWAVFKRELLFVKYLDYSVFTIIGWSSIYPFMYSPGVFQNIN